MHVAVDDNESEGLARGIAAEMRGPTRRGGEGRIGVQNRNERESGVESCKVRCKGAGMRTKREMETGKKVKEHRTTAGPRSSETECEAGRAQTLWGLPPNARLSYLAEGGANIVYRVSLSNHESSRDGEAYGVEGSDKTVRPVRTRRDQQSKNTNQNSKPRESSSQSSSPSQSSSRMLNTLLLRNRLLRLRKGTPAARSYVEILAHFDAYIRPLFGAHEVVDQALVLLPPGLTAGLNRQLREREAGAEAEARMQTATAMDKTRNERNEKNAESIEARPRGRRGVYLAEDEPFGLLITDMTPAAAASVADPGAGTGEWQQMWEFKPKWLVQSPSAPRDARRCRTCALRAMKRHDAAMAAATATCGVECQIGNTDERRKKAEEIGKDKDSFLSSALSSAHAFCPLDLVSDKFDDVLRAARCVVAGQQQHHALHHHPLHHHAGCRPLNDSSGDSAVWLARLLHRHPTLTTLRARQQQFDAVGLGGADAALEERAVAMALRDCTMYVRVRVCLGLWIPWYMRKHTELKLTIQCVAYT